MYDHENQDTSSFVLGPPFGQAYFSSIEFIFEKYLNKPHNYVHNGKEQMVIATFIMDWTGVCRFLRCKN